MNELSQRVRALELGLLAGDLARTADLAGEVQRLLEPPLPLSAPEQAPSSAVFAARVARLDAVCSRTSSRARSCSSSSQTGGGQGRIVAELLRPHLGSEQQAQHGGTHGGDQPLLVGAAGELTCA